MPNPTYTLTLARPDGQFVSLDIDLDQINNPERLRGAVVAMVGAVTTLPRKKS